MLFRFYYETAGGHTHLRVFAGRHVGALGKCGDLCMRNEEFEEFRAITQHSYVEFLPEHPRTRPSGIAQVDLAIKS
jgi:hypothetical protein